MAQLKIYSDIVTQDEKDCLSICFGDALNTGVTFQDVEAFVASMDADDNKIDIQLNCKGGDVREGWTIYDALRATGKEISATVEGQAASMASVILLAAPKEQRYAQPHATILIHNPYIPYAEGQLDADALAEMQKQMQAEQDKVLNLYVERTGTDRETLQKLMDAETRMTAEEAKEYGFISTIIAPASAHAAGTKAKQMNFIEKLKALIGEAEASAAAPVGMELTTETGGTLTVEREEGEPQVGDKASPDGTHKMPDGKTIIVTDGIITEIQEPAAGAADDELQQLRDENAQLKAQLEEANAKVTAAEAKAKTPEEARILNAVSIAGGIDKLAKHSNGAPAGRQMQGRIGEAPTEMNAMQKRTAEMLAKRKK